MEKSGNKDCVKNSTNSIEFSRHIKYPSGQNTFQCNGCDNTFCKISNLKRHKLTQAGSKIHKCKHCEKIFTDNSSLVNHMIVHTGENPYQCKVCARHLRGVLTSDKKHK